MVVSPLRSKWKGKAGYVRSDVAGEIEDDCGFHTRFSVADKRHVAKLLRPVKPADQKSDAGSISSRGLALFGG